MNGYQIFFCKEEELDNFIMKLFYCGWEILNQRKLNDGYELMCLKDHVILNYTSR